MDAKTEVAQEVAVESATDAAASASEAHHAAVVAQTAAEQTQNAVEELKEVQTETVVTTAEAAVALAQETAAMANIEAAKVIDAATQAIAENEVKESWQDEAIRTLQSQVTTLLLEVGTLTQLLRENSKPSTPESTQAETVTVTETVTAVEATQDQANNEPTPEKSGAESPGKRTRRARKWL